MRKLTDCLKINKEIDKSNNSNNFTRKPTEITLNPRKLNQIHQIQQPVEKDN